MNEIEAIQNKIYEIRGQRVIVVSVSCWIAIWQSYIR